MRSPVQAKPVQRQSIARCAENNGIRQSDACCGANCCAGACITGPFGISHCAGVCVPNLGQC